MDTGKQQISWIERIEDLVTMLEGSSVGELELTEAGTKIIIRRQPGMVMVSTQYGDAGQIDIAVSPRAVGNAAKADTGATIIAPLTGVYYAAPSPTSPPFVAVGDMVHAGQVIALIEAMKVFNEIQAETSGRVVALVATNGDVVQKGDTLIRLHPL